MRPNFEDFIGSNPCLYGRQILKNLGTTSYYVDEYDAIGFFGYEVEKIKPEDYPTFSATIGDLFDDNMMLSIYTKQLGKT